MPDPPVEAPVTQPPIARPGGGWHGVALVDLHSHVLPGVDDGAESPAESLAMLRLAEADGVRQIVATPHAARCPRQKIKPAVNLLNGLARDSGLAIQVLPGSEVALTDLAGPHDDLTRFQTINDTPYLLFELPLRGDWPDRTEEVIFQLQVAGLWPILAHAERYPSVQQDVSHLDNLIARDILVQVNAGSLLGQGGRNARQTAEKLLRRGWLHLIASDAHGVDHRPPELASAFDRVSELAGSAIAAWIAGNASAIIEGRPVVLSQHPNAASQT
ncbi:MAG TPA: CpsB/CapC family capsule biosynthesis tyrosine phosphatase [Thermomicrobiaceae bacterium]|nr:CpsB/CapC family capsule biosynthesis tyrosine phosphatase [Thermomicrobiaceae bacterium]